MRIILALIMLFSTTTTIPTPTTPSTQEVIFEDDPRWNCHTMGNLVCGPNHHNN